MISVTFPVSQCLRHCSVQLVIISNKFHHLRHQRAHTWVHTSTTDRELYFSVLASYCIISCSHLSALITEVVRWVCNLHFKSELKAQTLSQRLVDLQILRLLCFPLQLSSQPQYERQQLKNVSAAVNFSALHETVKNIGGIFSATCL